MYLTTPATNAHNETKIIAGRWNRTRRRFRITISVLNLTSASIAALLASASARLMRCGMKKDSALVYDERFSIEMIGWTASNIQTKEENNQVETEKQTNAAYYYTTYPYKARQSTSI